MKKEGIIYTIITLLFTFIILFIITNTNPYNNINLSKSIEIILILFLIKVSYDCTLHIKKLYKNKKYSYEIILNLGLIIFININILRQINLLIQNWKVLNIVDIYNNTLTSFSFFAMLTLPLIAIISIYSIITNVVLIKKEGFSYKNLLGIFLGLLSIIGLFSTQSIYIYTKILLTDTKDLVIKKLLDIIINISLSYFYTLIIATLYCNIKAANHIPNYDKEFVIILGCMIRKDGTLTPLLKSRVDRAIEFAKKQKETTGKDIIFVPSGGKGTNEIMSEGMAMKNYLIKQGIDKNNILIENKSTNTIENIKFSNEIINKNSKYAKICFSTTDYHVFRSGVIACKQGIDCEGMGSKSKWYFYTNALIREFIANIVQEKEKHIIILLLIYIIVVFLIIIGIYYNLIRF